MSPRAIAGLLVALTTAASGALAQDIPISPRLSYREITATLRDGGVVHGRLTGATAASILVRSGREDRSLALADLRRVSILTEAHPSDGVVPGIALGLYAGNSLLVWSTGGPGFYARHVESHSLVSGWLLAGEAFFAAMGAGIGWLAGSIGGQRSFEFPDAPGDSGRARDEFVRYLAGAPRPARIHFLIQSGFLLPGPSARFEDLTAAAGYAKSAWSSVTKFSLLRGLELSYSITPELRAGLRLSFPTEPVFNGYYLSETQGTYANATQEFRATAFHAVGVRTWSAGKGPRSLSVRAGLGVGVASFRLTREAFRSFPDGSGGTSYISEQAVIRKTLPSAVILGGFDLPLTAVLSVGLAADFTWIPAVTVPALPANGFGSRKSGLGNGSVGLLIGYHF
jgi:hypothetical protein